MGADRGDAHLGRGTRTYEGKHFFTIWDFVKAHENFEDPGWDGPPLPPEGEPPEPPSTPPEPPQEKIVVKLADGKERKIRYLRSTSYWDADGKPVSAAEFLERLFGDLKGIIADEDALRRVWSDPENREHFVVQLEDRGYDEDKLNDIRFLVDAQDSDLFDVLSYIMFTTSPLTRQDWADHLTDGGLVKFQGEMKTLLFSILQAYVEDGERELATSKLVQFLTARYGSVSEGKAVLGELSDVKAAFRQMQADLYCC